MINILNGLLAENGSRIRLGEGDVFGLPLLGGYATSIGTSIGFSALGSVGAVGRVPKVIKEVRYSGGGSGSTVPPPSDGGGGGGGSGGKMSKY